MTQDRTIKKVPEEYNEIIGSSLLSKELKDMKKYSFLKGLGKGITAFLLFAVPVIIDTFVVSMPEWSSLTLGGILVTGWNFVKVKYFRA